MKLNEYGCAILIQYSCDYPSPWHEVTIQPNSFEEFYEYLGRYFDGGYVEWNIASIVFVRHLDVYLSAAVPFMLNYRTDNLYERGQKIYLEYENYKLRNNV